MATRPGTSLITEPDDEFRTGAIVKKEVTFGKRRRYSAGCKIVTRLAKIFMER
jgi:hypothetical protein